MDNLEACPGDSYQRHPTAAGCNIKCAVARCPSMSSVSSHYAETEKGRWSLSVTTFGKVEAKSPKRLSFSPTLITELPANRKQLLLPGILEDKAFRNISFSLAELFSF